MTCALFGQLDKSHSMQLYIRDTHQERTPMQTNKSLIEQRNANIPAGIATMMPIVVAKAKNSELWDVEGQRYIDFAGGIGVLNTGHCHPKVIKAAQAQMEQFTHACFQVAAYESYINLASRLNQLAPGDTPKKSIFFSTGAEAVENAVKIARIATGRPGVIAFQGGFHGRTFLALSLTGKISPYKKGLGTLPGPVFHLPFPDQYHNVTEEQSFKALDELFKTDIDPSQVAAIIIEPVQGEGGFRIASPAFLQKLRKCCDEHGILLIADEIQSGFARTGKLFAIEHSDIEPDLITVAKSLAGGFPLSGVIGKSDIMGQAKPGHLGGTYAGNPIACAAALAVLEVIEEENLLERSNHIGEIIVERLKAIANTALGSRIGEIRNLGGMVAFELIKDKESHAPDPEFTKHVREKALELGLIILSCGVYGNAIRILVPLTVSDEVLSEGLDLLEKALS